jgi:DNA modification methylase
MGSEDFLPDRNSFDLCFSSPPYFDTEKYSGESTQSYGRFPSRESWLNGFLGATLDNCWCGLKSSGRLIINIANVSSYPTLESDFVAMACARGWELERTLRLALSKMMGTRRTGGESFKYEPVSVFKKEA